MAAAYRLPRGYRYPRYRRSASGAEIAIGIGVAAAVIAAAASPHPGTTGALHRAAASAGKPASAPRITGDLSTPAGWAAALLTAASLPRTSCNLAAVTAWEHAEGGGFGNQASGNPLNVNPGPGAGWPGHPAIGAWAFPDAATGLRYTVATLRNGYYGGILTALRAGNSAQAACDAIIASPWAASRYGGTLTANC